MVCPQGPPWRTRRGCALPDQCPLNPVRAALLLRFFTFWKFDFRGSLTNNAWKVLICGTSYKHSMLQKLLTMSCLFANVANYISPSPINIHLALYHKKFVQFSGISWRCLFISSMFVHAVLFCFLLFLTLWYSFLFEVWKCSYLKDNTGLCFKWIDEIECL